MRCVLAGMLDPTLQGPAIALVSDAEACSAVPEQLRNNAAAGAFAAPSLGVGRLDCAGLRPGEATLRFTANIGMIPPQNAELGRCHCGSTWDVQLDLVHEGRSTLSLSPLRNMPRNETSCREGPQLQGVTTIPVDADGRASIRVDLRTCLYGGEPTRCHFLSGTSLAIDQ
jgi:hypothetical protein